MNFDQESFAQVRHEIVPLIERHYEEIALYRDSVKLAPDWARYEYLEQNNELKIFTAREADKLIGYSVFFLYYHIHYVHTLVASNDVLYLDPEHRKGLAAWRFIRYSELQLEDVGVHRVLWHVKTDKDFRALLHRMGYADEETIVGKLLRSVSWP